MQQTIEKLYEFKRFKRYIKLEKNTKCQLKPYCGLWEIGGVKERK